MARILILVENLPVPLDRRVWQEARALRDAGHDVTVACPQMRGFTQPDETLEGIRILRHPLPVEACGMLGFLIEYTTALFGQFQMALKAWRTAPFDVIHLCNPPDILFLVALPFKWLGHVKVIFDVHDLWPEMFDVKFPGHPFIHRLTLLAERTTLRLSDTVIATNESVRRIIQRRGDKPETDLFVVRTSPDQLDTSAPADPTLKNGRAHLVAYIGVMGDADGVDLLLHAAHHLVHHLARQDVQFLLMGTGPQHDRLLQLRDSLNLQSHVDMPGRVSNSFLFTALQTMDLGVGCDPINAYNDHCTMNKTLEYMAFGKAQVVFGIHEGRISAADAADYVMENNPTLLGDAIARLLDDPQRRQQMGAIGQARLNGPLHWSHSVTQLLAAYAHTLAPHPTP